MQKNYTFLAIAPGSFNVNGRHYILEVGKPFEVPLATAKIIASPTFNYRKHIRIITPLPTAEEERAEAKAAEEAKPVEEPKKAAPAPKKAVKAEEPEEKPAAPKFDFPAPAKK